MLVASLLGRLVGVCLTSHVSPLPGHFELKALRRRTTCHFAVDRLMCVRFWPIAGAAVIEIVAALLTVRLLVPMSGMEQAVPEVDWLFSV